MDAIQKNLLEQVAGLHEIPEGAYNIRSDGQLAGRNTTANMILFPNRTSPVSIFISNRELQMKVYTFRLF